MGLTSHWTTIYRSHTGHLPIYPHCHGNNGEAGKERRGGVALQKSMLDIGPQLYCIYVDANSFHQ